MLRRHVAKSTRYELIFFTSYISGYSEINEFDEEFIISFLVKNVLRLDIAMQDLFIMQVGQS